MILLPNFQKGVETLSDQVSQERALSRSCNGLNPVMSRVIVSATNRGSRRLIPDAPMRHHSLVQLPLSTPKALRASLPLEE